MPKRRIRRARAVALRRSSNGFFDASGTVRCVLPARTTSRSSGPPAEATYEVHPASTSAPAISTVPRSAPPEPRRGTIWSTAGGRPFATASPVLPSTPIPFSAEPPMSSPGILARHDDATIAYRQVSRGLVLCRLPLGYDRYQGLVSRGYCRSRGHAFVRFDYFGHGGSSG